jgi:oxygen-dependent protoporphyrinogen oxidase
MKRIAIIGGGIAGVAAAYELSRQQRAGAAIEFTLFEATHRLGGIVETERRDGFVVECGPDSWVTEKDGARELAIELRLESEIIFSQDQHRKTYLAQGNTLTPLPHGMRMMVPVEWPSVLASPLFSRQAKLDYQREPQLAEQLKATALDAWRLWRRHSDTKRPCRAARICRARARAWQFDSRTSASSSWPVRRAHIYIAPQRRRGAD